VMTSAIPTTAASSTGGQNAQTFSAIEITMVETT
jgi:hypothetical protein